jgi:hypothetical protein
MLEDLGRTTDLRERDRRHALGVDALPEAAELSGKRIRSDGIGDVGNRREIAGRLESRKPGRTQRLVETIECRVQIPGRGHVSSDRRSLGGPPLQSAAL